MPRGLPPFPTASLRYSKGASVDVLFRSQPLEIIRSSRQSRDWSCYQNADCGDQLLSYLEGMNDRSQRVAGIFIAPLLMLGGLWLCFDSLEHGGLSGIFWIGPFVAVAGALWFVSDWFE